MLVLRRFTAAEGGLYLLLFLSKSAFWPRNSCIPVATMIHFKSKVGSALAYPAASFFFSISLSAGYELVLFKGRGDFKSCEAQRGLSNGSFSPSVFMK